LFLCNENIFGVEMGIDNKNTIGDIKKAFILSKEKIDEHIHELRVLSSEEVLNGSIEEAQKILNHILPIEGAAKKTDAISK